MNNYADFFQDELKAIDSSEVKSKKQLIQSLNIKGRFIHHNYESNQQFTDSSKFRKVIREGVQLWDVPRLRYSWLDQVDEDDEMEFNDEEVDED